VTDRPPISVMLATIRGWPDARLPVDATREQVARVGGEIVVIDGSGRPPPGPDELGPDVRWISRPGESVFQMRSAGYEACRGEIVAVTEDHCEPASDWIDRILAAHGEHPEAIAVGGTVENGTTDHLIDWATFIVTQGPFVPPIPNGPADRIVGAASSSYKRAVLSRRPDHGELGAIELFDTGEMRRPGDILLNDDSIRVSHHQSMGLSGTATSQFHNGRAIAGFRRREMTRGDWLRVIGFPILPLYRTARTVRIAWGKRLPRSIVVITIPLMTFLHYVQASGEFVGYLAGPGSSPRRLR
jgi:glycosyl transferase family 2